MPFGEISVTFTTVIKLVKLMPVQNSAFSNYFSSAPLEILNDRLGSLKNAMVSLLDCRISSALDSAKTLHSQGTSLRPGHKLVPASLILGVTMQHCIRHVNR